MRKKLAVLMVLCGMFAAGPALAWDPIWTLKVKVKGTKKEKTFHPSSSVFKINGIGSAQCQLGKVSTATGSASRVITCKKGKVEKERTIGFTRKLQTSKDFEFWFSGKEKGEPDVILELACCTKKK